MDDPDIYAYVEAYDLDPEEDRIAVIDPETNMPDFLEGVTVIKEGDAVMIKGYSHTTGDNALYTVPEDREVGLWII